MILDMPCLIANGSKIEVMSDSLSIDEAYSRQARNILRYLTYSASYQSLEISVLQFCRTLIVSLDVKLLSCIRHEIQMMMNNACVILNSNDHHDSVKGRIATFSNKLLLALLPFLNLQDNEIIRIPTLLNKLWETIPYRVCKLDISPRRGLLSYLIPKSERLFAYGLSTDDRHSNAKPYLLIMGSSYPSLPGHYINWLYNFMPWHSIGEKHNTDEIAQWLTSHSDCIVIGHSKGGTLAAVLAAKYPYYIAEAYCMCPAALNHHTISRYKNQWQQLDDTVRPKVSIYTNYNDPVFLLGSSFMSGSRLFCVSTPIQHNKHFSAHLKYIIGFNKSSVEELPLTTYMKNHRQVRLYFYWGKQIADIIFFPLLYFNCIFQALAHYPLQCLKKFTVMKTFTQCLQFLVQRFIPIFFYIIGHLPVYAYAFIDDDYFCINAHNSTMT